MPSDASGPKRLKTQTFYFWEGKCIYLGMCKKFYWKGLNQHFSGDVCHLYAVA